MPNYTIQTRGQGSVVDNSTYVDQSNVPYGSLGWTGEEHMLRVNVTATPDQGWIFDHWEWAYKHTKDTWGSQGQGTEWESRYHTVSNSSSTDANPDNPIPAGRIQENPLVNSAGASPAYNITAGEMNYLDPTWYPYDGYYGGEQVLQRSGRKYRHLFSDLVITAVFVPGDGPIIRNDAGAILRSDAGVIIRQG